MDTKNKKDFKAVEFIREVREEMSTLYTTDEQHYFEEIRKAMADFKDKREKTRQIILSTANNETEL